MNTSFYNGIGGMKTAQFGIDVWGDNIANDNTIGFKQQNIDFATLFSTTLNNTSLNSPVTSDIGVSAKSATTTMDTSQGTLQFTDSVFDIALQGKGWLSVKDENNQTFYTRTGAFNRDSNGTLVSENGDKLQVIDAKNLTFDGKNWNFDSKVATDKIVNDSAEPTSINLPDNIIFPPQATQKVRLGGNLPNEEIAPTPKPAILSNDFGVLYDGDGRTLNMVNGQDLMFGFGENITYSDDLIRYNFCIVDDELDGKNVNIDFDVNGENIKLELPDGSSKKDIIDAITSELDNKNILYSKTDDSIQIKDNDKILIKSNGGDIVTENSSMERLTYNSKDNTDLNFTTIEDFITKLQELASFTYQDKASVNLDEKGRIFISNNVDSMDLKAITLSTDQSNQAFLQNLGALGNVIKPNTSSNSLSFNQNYQGFGGEIIDSDGNKNNLKFDFYKTKIDGNNTIWNLTISEIDENGTVLSTKSEDLKFDYIGGLLTPTTIEFDNNGTATTIDLGGNFDGMTAIDKKNSGFVYSQDGFVKGNLVAYDVSDTGQIIANFSNSKSGVLGQIPIYHFQNEQGLDSIGSSKFTTTNNSGDAFFYKDSNGDYLVGATISNYSLESSNVNIGQAMTELIIIQKAFDANSKSITTSDQMIQKAIDMKR